MTLTPLLITLIIGAIAGWLAGLIVKGGGFGLLGNIVIGIVGALIGGFLLSFFLDTAAGGEELSIPVDRLVSGDLRSS